MSRRISHTFLSLCFLVCLPGNVLAQKYNFDSDWHCVVDDAATLTEFYTHREQKAGSVRNVTLPYAWNEDSAFAVNIAELPVGVAWYWKSFSLPTQPADGHVFVEFEGVRQAADVWVNGQFVGYSENGVMAFGFELTPYLQEGKNEIVVRTDNRWDYRERVSGATLQWNNRNFNANYGGINRHVNLYVKGAVFQTLPLYSNLKTTGVYIYGTDYDIPKKKATVHIESQTVNSSDKSLRLALQTEIFDVEGRRVASFKGASQMVASGDTLTLTTSRRLSGLHFWSWGYGYLYTVKTRVMCGKECLDETVTRTGFRKTRFAEGKIWLNDRVMMVHGFAQRSTNEWPAVGVDIPAWMSDYTNSLMVDAGGNVVRWMHVTPSRQDVLSCDRVGLLQAVPAGDSEGDSRGRQWEARVELMRDAIIYLRNSPSILFWEGGNESISREHMKALLAVRDEFDPHGGRAMGSREMLDIDEAEYGGEMLYINKSAGKPLWAMEYCRDEGYRLYWDDNSYPWHRSGNGPLHKKQPATDYNRNQDDLTIEHIRRWYDYWVERPGMGRRVSSGGVKIIFSDTNTHGRSEFSHRVSGVVDAMRIPKDSYFAHQVMWGSWVETEHNATRIIGHWNYEDGIRKLVYVVSTSPVVELLLNGEPVARSEKAEYAFLHTFNDVEWKPGVLKAIGYAADEATVESEDIRETAGAPSSLRLTLVGEGLRSSSMLADGSDAMLIEVEVVDAEGRRCPLDNRTIQWSLEGPAVWRGGLAKSPDRDNHILDTDIPVECGVGRVLVRSTSLSGTITLTASAKGLPSESISWQSVPVAVSEGLGTSFSEDGLRCHLDRGETPLTPSYKDHKRSIAVIASEAGANNEDAPKSYDDNELSEWHNDGRLSTAWITYTLAEETTVDDVCLKLTGWRQRSYPLEILAGDSVVWRGNTPRSLGYVHLAIEHPIPSRTITLRQIGALSEKEAFGQIVEVAAPTAGELDLYKTPGSENVKGELRIVEADFLQSLP